MAAPSRRDILKDIHALRASGGQLRQAQVPQTAYDTAKRFVVEALNVSSNPDECRFHVLYKMPSGRSIYHLLADDAAQTTLAGASAKITVWREASKALLKYALNLLLAPKRPEFQRLKLSNSYYVYQVSKKLKGAEEILVAMGYEIVGRPNEAQEFKYKGEVDIDLVAQAAADLVILDGELERISALVKFLMNEQIPKGLTDILKVRNDPYVLFTEVKNVLDNSVYHGGQPQPTVAPTQPPLQAIVTPPQLIPSAQPLVTPQQPMAIVSPAQPTVTPHQQRPSPTEVPQEKLVKPVAAKRTKLPSQPSSHSPQLPGRVDNPQSFERTESNSMTSSDPPSGNQDHLYANIQGLIQGPIAHQNMGECSHKTSEEHGNHGYINTVRSEADRVPEADSLDPNDLGYQNINSDHRTAEADSLSPDSNHFEYQNICSPVDRVPEADLSPPDPNDLPAPMVQSPSDLLHCIQHDDAYYRSNIVNARSDNVVDFGPGFDSLSTSVHGTDFDEFNQQAVDAWKTDSQLGTPQPSTTTLADYKIPSDNSNAEVHVQETEQGSWVNVNTDNACDNLGLGQPKGLEKYHKPYAGNEKMAVNQQFSNLVPNKDFSKPAPNPPDITPAQDPAQPVPSTQDPAPPVPSPRSRRQLTEKPKSSPVSSPYSSLDKQEESPRSRTSPHISIEDHNPLSSITSEDDDHKPIPLQQNQEYSTDLESLDKTGPKSRKRSNAATQTAQRKNRNRKLRGSMENSQQETPNCSVYVSRVRSPQTDSESQQSLVSLVSVEGASWTCKYCMNIVFDSDATICDVCTRDRAQV